MKTIFYLVASVLLVDIVSAQGDIRCPGGGMPGVNRCSRFFPDLSCSPNFYCYDPFIDVLGNGICCPRRNCPPFGTLLCLSPVRRCLVDSDCPRGSCCPQVCGPRCAPP